MRKTTKLAVVLSLVASVGCAGIASAVTPVKVWEETSPFSGGNVYYGSVVDDVYYTGQIATGVLSYSSTQTAKTDGSGTMTALQNSYKYVDTNGTKSATKVGNNIYVAGANANGVKQLSNWATMTQMAVGAGAPEEIATDGTYLYGNDYASNRNTVRKYSISGTNLTVDWAAALSGASKIRGISCYGGNVYAVDDTTGVYELNASTGSASKIISWSGMTGYQAARSGNTIYVAAASGNLYQFTLSGGAWNLGETTDLGLGALYGVGVNSAGTGLWVSSNGFKVAYYSVQNPVPEPSSMLAMAGGLFGLAGFGLRRRRA